MKVNHITESEGRVLLPGLDRKQSALISDQTKTKTLRRKHDAAETALSSSWFSVCHSGTK